ncbi:MAG: hypothetical protein ACP5RD_06765, partial [bacterium]
FNLDENAIKSANNLNSNNLNLVSLSNFNYNDLISILERLENIFKDLNEKLDAYLSSKDKVQQDNWKIDNNQPIDTSKQLQDIQKLQVYTQEFSFYLNEINNEIKNIKVILENKLNKRFKFPFF